MVVKRFYDEKLAQASYLVGCGATGEAAVIDPSRNIAQYLEAATNEGLQIVAVTETHIHADYVSGSRELGEVTGATVYLSDEGDENWKYGYANEPNVRLVKHGDRITIGNVSLEVVHTPGHTPEHISFILRDHPVSDSPMAVFTGDFVFVGDVGRPDLLERAANYQGTMVQGAKTLFKSLQSLSTWPQHMLIWPAHGAGSACGKSLGGVPVSTVGYERATNWALQHDDENRFVESVLEGQPEPPAYFKHMKRINKMGPESVYGKPFPPELSGDQLLQTSSSANNIVDIRPQADSVKGFVPGSLLIAMAKGFPNWAGWLLDYEKPIYLIARNESEVGEAVNDLRSVGLDDVRGWFPPEAIAAWAASGHKLASIAEATPESAFDACSSGVCRVLDVRGKTEEGAGMVANSVHIPLGELRSRTSEVPTDLPLVVICASGYRAGIACGILKECGIEDATIVRGEYPPRAKAAKEAAAV